MIVDLAYQRPTTITQTLTSAALDFATNLHREPVAFHALVRQPYRLRQLMLALHEVVVSDLRWQPESTLTWLLDPVITVHHDQLFFEAFSNDESCYARLSASLDAFTPLSETRYGTTNIDFTHELRAAVQTMRSSRATTFTVGGGGFGLATAGPQDHQHFERKVDLPDSWVKGFLQVQAALAMRPYLFTVRAVDLLTVITLLAERKTQQSPRALRFVFEPDQPISVVLEPWGDRVVFKGSHYRGYQRQIRVWGRRRLALLQGVLPYAEQVTIGLLGRGLPQLYLAHCGAYQFALVLSGWTSQDWSKGSALDLLAPPGPIDAELTARVYAALTQSLVATRQQLQTATLLPPVQIERALVALSRAGRVMADPTTGGYRLRELFPTNLAVDELFQPDPRLAEAEALVAAGVVRLDEVQPPAADSVGRWELRARATVANGGARQVELAVDRDGRLRFARCDCAFFQENLMARGPCPHILAARLVLDGHWRPLVAADRMEMAGESDVR